MKMRFWTMGLALFLALGAVAVAATYYIDDNSNDGDVYTPGFTGNDANNGLSPTAPKLTLNNLLASTNLLPGDIVLIDTGTYTTNVVIGAGVNGTTGTPIVFQGSTATRPWGGGTVFSGSGIIIEIRGRYLSFADISALGGSVGMCLNGSSYGEYERLYCISNNANSLLLVNGASSNVFNRLVLLAVQYAPLTARAPCLGNYIENSILRSIQSYPVYSEISTVTNFVNNICWGTWGGGYNMPEAGSGNIFFGSPFAFRTYETLSDLQNSNANWHHNTVADPKFVNAEGLDFHLLSAAGFVSNGVWVTNAAVGFSPAIDFGARE